MTILLPLFNVKSLPVENAPSKDFMQMFKKKEIKEIDREFLKTLLRVVVSSMTECCTWETIRKLSVQLFLFEVWNKYGLTAFKTSVSYSLSTGNLTYNQHHSHRNCVCACEYFYSRNIIWGIFCLLFISVNTMFSFNPGSNEILIESMLGDYVLKV